ncbi:MAG: Dyp-type peroxidase [Rothia sp. (in: high G+C Gram-positive bacteria)]|nr:Dyp-type peroxidase [Rothia sp. (in: high G+C Gram-positive bacteria)]
MSESLESRENHGASRRTIVAGALGAGVGVAATLGTQSAVKASANSSQQTTRAEPALGENKVSFYGARQAGIDTAPPSYAMFIAIDLNESVDRNALKRLLKIVTEDAATLTQGKAPVIDQESELTAVAASLTVTFGFGERIFEIANPAKKPSWLKPLPAFEKIDQLQDQWNDGDLLIQLCCDDRLTLAHAQRLLLKDIRSFGRVRWMQEGFRRANGSEKPAQTMRNLFGQVDGTINPSLEDTTMEDFVWGGYSSLTPWEEGGTSAVIRRIHMNLDTWDQADRPAREDAVGRKLSNGAPLTGEQEHDVTDLSATNELGFTVIAPYAHIRRASAQAPEEHILRRGYNYDLPVQNASGFSEHFETSGGVSNTGLIFAAYQADPVKQFVPIQKRLAEVDMLNTWTVPIGSAVFAIPGGCQPGGFIGEKLFE